MSKEVEARLGERVYLNAQEPTAGSGAMIIALAQEIRELGITTRNTCTSPPSMSIQNACI